MLMTVALRPHLQPPQVTAAPVSHDRRLNAMSTNRAVPEDSQRYGRLQAPLLGHKRPHRLSPPTPQRCSPGQVQPRSFARMSACPRGRPRHCHRYLTRLSDRPASQVFPQHAAGVANACSASKFVYVFNMSNIELMIRLESVLRDAASRVQLHPEHRLSVDELITLRNTHGGASCSYWRPLRKHVPDVFNLPGAF